MPAGRPSSYNPEYCEQVIELGKAGKSQVQIAVALDIPRTTMLSWADSHEEFSTALTRAKECEQAWWEDQAQTGAAQETIGPAVWKTSVAARFRGDYTERKEVSGADGEPLVPEGDSRELAKALLGILQSANTTGSGEDDA